MNSQVLEGTTLIDLSEAEGLIPEIRYQHELNEFERNNIIQAYRWASRSRKLKKELLTVPGLMLLHKEMFGQVWEWAGTFRKTEKNIGNVLAFQVAEEVYKLCADTKYHIEQGVRDWDLLAVKFHHRLVLIHPFPNGNGRHARFATDLLLRFNNQPELTWGGEQLVGNDEILRKDYIQALREADRGDLSKLLEFARR